MPAGEVTTIGAEELIFQLWLVRPRRRSPLFTLAISLGQTNSAPSVRRQPSMPGGSKSVKDVLCAANDMPELQQGAADEYPPTSTEYLRRICLKVGRFYGGG